MGGGDKKKKKTGARLTMKASVLQREAFLSAAAVYSAMPNNSGFSSSSLDLGTSKLSLFHSFDFRQQFVTSSIRFDYRILHFIKRLNNFSWGNLGSLKSF